MRRHRRLRQIKVPQLKIDYKQDSNNSTAIILPQEQLNISNVNSSPENSDNSSPIKLIKIKPIYQNDQNNQYKNSDNNQVQLQKKETFDSSYDSTLFQIKKIPNQTQTKSETIKTQHFIYDSNSQSNQSDKEVEYSSQQYQDSQQQEKIQKIQQRQEQYQDDKEEQEIQKVKQSKLIRKQKLFIAQSFDDLIRSSLPRLTTINCIIICHQQFLSTTRSYELYLVKEKKKLLSASKSKIQIKSQYLIRSPKKQIGKVKSNFTGTQYKLIVGKQERQLCWIGYNINLIGLSGQRDLKVLRNPNKILQQVNHFSNIKTYCENGMSKKFQKFENKKSLKKNDRYQINFHGKVTYPSVRNFIIEDEQTNQSIIFGKKQDGIYIMQVGNPFSILEAFAVALSSLDRKMFVR